MAGPHLQESRRSEIERILVNLGADPSSFSMGGDLKDSSDDDLRDMAKRVIEAGRKLARATNADWSLYGHGKAAFAQRRKI